LEQRFGASECRIVPAGVVFRFAGEPRRLAASTTGAV
jgi:hypothetical protein